MTFDPSDPIGSVFAEIVSKYAWQVRQGYGSFLTLEFGEPWLDVREAAPDATFASLRRRQVVVRGDWHLWINCCDWKVLQDGALVAHSESDRDAIAKATYALDGLILMAVRADPHTSVTRFIFESGALLETTPYERGDDETWLLYSPGGHVLCLRADAHYSWQSGTTSPTETVWHSLPA